MHKNCDNDGGRGRYLEPELCILLVLVPFCFPLLLFILLAYPFPSVSGVVGLQQKLAPG